MADKGVLDIGERGDLSRLVVSVSGYSAIRRGTATLYPVRNADGDLYFSRKPQGDGATGNTNALVDFASD